MLSAAKHPYGVYQTRAWLLQDWLKFSVEYDWTISTMKQYYVYIMSSKSGTLYTGMTNNLARRVYEHKHKLTPGFTQKYNDNRLVYFETFNQVRDAIAREKAIKGWLRQKKIALIESFNPTWSDLSEEWE